MITSENPLYWNANWFPNSGAQSRDLRGRCRGLSPISVVARLTLGVRHDLLLGMPRGQKGSINKSAWIRDQPANLTAQEVVENAKKEGISLTAAQVYTVRHAARKATGASKKPAAATAASPKVKGKPGPKPKAQRSVESDEIKSSTRTEFARLVLSIGMDKSRALLDRIERQGLSV